MGFYSRKVKMSTIKKKNTQAYMLAMNLQQKKDMRQDKTDENKVRYNRECAKVRLAINQAKRSTWAKTTGELNLAQDGTKARSLLNNLSGDNRRENPKPMTINNTTIVEDQ